MLRRGNGAARESALVSGMSFTDPSNAPPSTKAEGAPHSGAGDRPGELSPGDRARRVMRRIDRAALATIQRPTNQGPGDAGTGWPYPSLVLVALDHDATPLLLISALADHTRNIAADPRVGLLFDATAGLDEPLTGARVSVLGRAERSDDRRHRDRFLARHPGAALYAGFGDFSIYRVVVDRAHLVAGFGKIHWIASSDLLLPNVPLALAENERDILTHMNTDHADAVALYATALADPPPPADGDGAGWAMTGLDPEGCDLRRGAAVARVDFTQRIYDPPSARMALVGLARRAREGSRSVPDGDGGRGPDSGP